ncbi:MAG: hypothetical protein JXB07_14220, partial [Anaerolineae bacterium]|nr:hypothetical protein [Anaerolineae bacterium]
MYWAFAFFTIKQLLNAERRPEVVAECADFLFFLCDLLSGNIKAQQRHVKIWGTKNLSSLSK